MTAPRKIPRGSLKAYAIGLLRTKQGGNCAVCGLAIDLTVKGNKSDYVVDHDHKTGMIRGILHRSCNGAEGKVLNAAGRWGAGGTDLDKVIPFMEKLVAYWKHHYYFPSGVIYPDHKTDEEKAAAARVKANKAAALRRAKARAAEIKQQKEVD